MSGIYRALLCVPLSLLPVLDHPQREAPSDLDTGKQQKHGCARDGIGCTGFLDKQSGRADDQACTTEHRNAYVGKSVVPAGQNQTDFVPRDGHFNLISQPYNTAQAENDPDWQR